MNSIESICQREFRRGWIPKLAMIVGGQWECLMDCGVGVLPENVPRPRATGASAVLALTLAIRARDKILLDRKAA